LTGLERAFREEWSAIVAALARRIGLQAAEDAAAEAFAAAAKAWREGMPPNPGGWLMLTARRKAVDQLRRDRAVSGLGWVAWLASSGSGYGRFVLPMIIAGVGVSMAVPAVPAAALGAVAPQDMGRASGVNNTLQRFGGAFGVAVAAAVFSAHGQLGSPAGMTAGFRPALAVSALLSLLGAGTAVLAGRRAGAQAAPVAAPQPEVMADADV
jgi:hypothetical protein